MLKKVLLLTTAVLALASTQYVSADEVTDIDTEIASIQKDKTKLQIKVADLHNTVTKLEKAQKLGIQTLSIDTSSTIVLQDFNQLEKNLKNTEIQLEAKQVELINLESKEQQLEKQKSKILVERARKAAEEKRLAEEKAKKEAEAKRLAEEKAKQEAEAKRLAEEQAQKEAEQAALEAEQAQVQAQSGTTVTGSTNYTVHATNGTYPVGQCTWGVKSVAPWVGDYWGNGGQWAASAAAQGFVVNQTPAPGAVIVWTDGGYGHVGYVTDVQSTTSIQIVESNYAGNQYIGNFRGWFNPLVTGGTVSYIHPK